MSVQYFVLTFDQPMLAGDPTVDPDSVLNAANYELFDANGNLLSNAISHVDYGLNEVAKMAGTYGLNPVPSNKYEVILTLDGSSNEPGNQSLPAGTYTLQVNQAIQSSLTSVGQTGLRNIYGTPLYFDGFHPNGLTFSKTITIGAASNAGAPGIASQDLPVNDVRGGEQIDPSVSAASNGNYVVVWIANGNVVGERYTFNGTPINGQFTINTTASATWSDPRVSMNPSGAFVVVWSGGGPGTDAINNSSDVYARRFNASGQALGGQFLVNQYLPSVQNQASVALAPDGTFVITWTSYGEVNSSTAATFPGVTNTNAAIYAREYSPAGTPVDNSTFQPAGNEFQVSNPSTLRRSQPDVAIDANDDFVIVWAGDFQDSSTWGVYGNYFYANGAFDRREAAEQPGQQPRQLRQ